MKKCAYCRSTILLGGKKDGSLDYCNTRCQQRGALIARSRSLPEADVRQAVMSLHQGLCPMCHGPGPVDVHVSHRVWSLVVVTGWMSRPQVCCQACGTRAKLMDSAFCLVCGWWGIPWGLLMTPVQIGRNLYGLARQPDPSQPSAALENAVRLHIAAQTLANPAAQAVRKAA